MGIVTTKEMFEKAYKGGYAIGAFNVNNMEIIQGITEGAKETNSPIILQVSAGARKYAKHNYLVHLVQAAVEDTDLPIALHLDHGADFDICKKCIDGGFSSVPSAPIPCTSAVFLHMPDRQNDRSSSIIQLQTCGSDTLHGKNQASADRSHPV